MNTLHITSLPGSRDAPCREANLRFRHLKSLFRKSTKFLLIYRYSLAISALGNQYATRKLQRLIMLVDRFVDAVDRRFSCSPLLVRERQSFFEFQSTQRKDL